MKKINYGFYSQLFMLLTMMGALLSAQACSNQMNNNPIAQPIKINDTVPSYPVVVKFLSVCCGVPSDAPLRLSIREFKRKYKIEKIKAVHIGPLGREGEYDLAFEMNGITPSRKRDFIKKMKLAVMQMKDKGKAVVELDVSYDRSKLPSRLSFEQVTY